MNNQDKLYHFIAGLLISIIVGYFYIKFALLIVCTIAMVKEIYDLMNPKLHTADHMDFLATVIGGLVGTLQLLLLNS